MKQHYLMRNYLKIVGNGRLTILQYHKVPIEVSLHAQGEIIASDFSRMISNYLNWFDFLPLNEAVERLARGQLPPNAAAVTFDDGYTDWFDHVVPFLSAHQIPATFFITSGQLGKNEPFWHERIANALLACGPRRLPKALNIGIDYTSNQDKGIASTISFVQEKLKYMSLDERESAIALIEDGLPKDKTFKPFTAADVIRLRDAGFQIGGHSKNHPILTRCNFKEAQDEIGGCKEELEFILKEPITQFAYPNGRPEIDFAKEHIKLVRQVGYRLAVSTTSGVAQSSTDVFQLPRFTPWARSNWRGALQILRNMRVTPSAISNE